MPAPKYYTPKPPPEGEAITVREGNYVLTADNEVFVVFDRTSWLVGGPAYGKTFRTARRVIDQNGPIATAVRAVSKIRATMRAGEMLSDDVPEIP